MKSRLFVWMALSSVGIVALVVVVTRRAARQVPPTIFPETSEETARAISQELLPVDGRSAVVPSATVGDFLKEYWGDHWAEMKEAYAQSGVLLSEDLESARLMTWEDARPEIQRLARSYYERDVPMVSSLFLLNTDKNEDPEAPFTEADAELEYLRDSFVAELDAAMNKVLSQEPERYPLADLRPQEKRPGDFFRIRVEHGGWYVMYRCNYNDFPEIARLEKEKGPLLDHRWHGRKASSDDPAETERGR